MKIRSPDLSSNSVNDEHARVGIPPVEEKALHPSQHPVLQFATGFAVLSILSLFIYLVWRLFFPDNLAGGVQTVIETLNTPAFWTAVAVGFFAQAIDGALGMAYGVTATTFLLSTGVSPAAASASVHIAEVFTTGFSGISHVRYGNINRKLFLRLLLPGLLGALTGTVLVTQIDGAILKPFIAAYLLLIGLYILRKAWHKHKANTDEPRHVGKLAVVGGFVDTVGGGGWGPVVTSTLVGSGHDPRTTIGSVNFAEFFLALATAASFSLLIETTAWVTIAGLVFGGLFAAPFAALLCSKLKARSLLVLVGVLITCVSLYNLVRALS